MKIIVKQPDSQFALFDFTDRFFVMKDATVEEIRNRLVRKATRVIDSDIVGCFYDRAKEFKGGHDPFYDTFVELENEND